MVENAQRIHNVESALGEWEPAEVCLYEIYVLPHAVVVRGYVDGPTQVDGRDMCTAGSGVVGVTARSTACVEDLSATPIKFSQRLDIPVEVLLVSGQELIESMPFKAEARGGTPLCQFGAA